MVLEPTMRSQCRIVRHANVEHIPACSKLMQGTNTGSTVRLHYMHKIHHRPAYYTWVEIMLQRKRIIGHS